jgi:hypothetical protein
MFTVTKLPTGVQEKNENGYCDVVGVQSHPFWDEVAQW